MIVTTNELTSNEQRLVEVLTNINSWTELQFDIVNPRREFDVRITGKNQNGSFSLILFRAAINRMIKWWEPDVAQLTDYPEMCIEGDWSGVRDTNELKLWNIFDRFVLPKLKQREHEIVKSFSKSTLDLMAEGMRMKIKLKTQFWYAIKFDEWSIVVRSEGTFMQLIYKDHLNLVKHEELQLN